MFRNIIAPVQAWLLSQGRCVGCGTSLSEGKRVKMSPQEEQVICVKCGRIFIYNIKTRRYHRAPIKSP